MRGKEITDLLQKIPVLMDVLHALQRNLFIFHPRRVADGPASTSSGHTSILSALCL
jgi:hypothetical protein